MNSLPTDFCMSPILLPDDDNQLIDLGNDLEIFPEILHEFEPIIGDVGQSNGDTHQQMVVQDGSDSDSGISVISDQRDGSPLKPVQHVLESITTEIVYENEVPITECMVPPETSRIQSQNLRNRILIPVSRQSKQISIQNPVVYNNTKSDSRYFPTKYLTSNSMRMTADYQNRNKFVQVKLEHSIPDNSVDMKSSTIGVHTSGKNNLRSLSEDAHSSTKFNSILKSQIKIQPKPEMQTYNDQGFEAVYIGKNSPNGSDNSSEIIYDPFSTVEDIVVDDSFNLMSDTPNSGYFHDVNGMSSWSPSPEYNPLQIDPSCTLQPLLSVSSAVSSNVNTPGVNGQMQLDRMIKKQERMIKNRQAASLSRQRKKEYMERLETRVEQLREENASLRHQNLEWRERYMELEARLRDIEKQGTAPIATTQKPHQQSSVSFFPGMKSRATLTATAATTMLTVVMLLAVNIHPSLFIASSSSRNSFSNNDVAQPVGGLLPNGVINGLSIRVASSGGHLSRRLMSIDQPMQANNTREGMKQRKKDYSMCQDLLYNATEAERLVSELKGWATHHSGKGYKKTFLPKDSTDKIRLRRGHSSVKVEERQFIKTPYPLNYDDYLRLKQISRNFPSSATNLNYPRMPIINQNTVQIYNPTFDSYAEQLLSSIDRKNDTMYVVSLRTDHLVFPATVQNKTSVIPKIAFLIPATHGFRDSLNPNKVTMMQIECQVTNFTTVYLDKWQVPSNDPKSGPSTL